MLFKINTKYLLIVILMIYYFNDYISLEIKNNKKWINNFDYTSFENDIISKDMIKNAGWMFQSSNQYYFINGIIRKHKPKTCLEIGVANGGSSILILNAIKDIKNSKLISLDLNTNLYCDPKYKTGYRVKQYFPELSKSWHLFTGEQPHIFLQKLGIKFDFVFLDTAHVNPGEIINLLEILPFLKENALIIIHDIVYHFMKESWKSKIQSISSPCLHLLSVLYGDKIFIKNNDDIDNIGAIYLYNNQKKHYLDYFLLLLSFWEYMPTEKQINELRKFFIKYYKNDLYIFIFDFAIKNNRKYVNKIKKYIK